MRFRPNFDLVVGNFQFRHLHTLPDVFADPRWYRHSRANCEPDIQPITKPDVAADLETIAITHADTEPGTNRPAEPKSNARPVAGSNPGSVAISHTHTHVGADFNPDTPANPDTDQWPDHAADDEANIGSNASSNPDSYTVANGDAHATSDFLGSHSGANRGTNTGAIHFANRSPHTARV